MVKLKEHKLKILKIGGLMEQSSSNPSFFDSHHLLYSIVKYSNMKFEKFKRY